MENKKGIMSIESLFMPEFLKGILKRCNILDVNTLRALTSDNLKCILESEYREYYGITEEELNLSIKYAYHEIVYALHASGYTLKDEFIHIGLPKEVTEYSLTNNIYNAETRVKLRNNKISIMGDLLNLNPDTMAIIFNSDEFLLFESISNNLGFSLFKDFYAKKRL